MLWDIRLEWPSGIQFTFNFYFHWATLVVRNVYWSGQFFIIKKGATQGDPLDMILYGIGILPLIHELHIAHTHITQP